MSKKPPRMKTAALIEAAGGARKVADALGTSTQAIYAWGDDVPLLRLYQLKAEQPQWFKGQKK